jgi:hypothetical protein
VAVERPHDLLVRGVVGDAVVVEMDGLGARRLAVVATKLEQSPRQIVIVKGHAHHVLVVATDLLEVGPLEAHEEWELDVELGESLDESLGGLLF